MSVYYQDDFVTLYHGDSLEILPTLNMEAQALLTDPPYFKVKKDAWDNQWGAADQFLNWMGMWLDSTKPLLADNASAWVFASPAMTSSVERVVGSRFRVLNSIRWIKQAGWHNRAELDSLRSYLTPWEGIIFAEQVNSDRAAQAKSGWAEACKALHQEVFSPIGAYLRGEWERGGWIAGKLGVELGYDSAMPTRWAEGGSLPTTAAYERLRQLLGEGYLLRDLHDLRQEYGRLKVVYEERRKAILHLQDEFDASRRWFNIDSREHSSDVWHFPTVKPYKGKHPCEKPAEMLRHMIDVSSKPGGLILDPFAGSGSTLEAARQAGRRAVGIEQDERWCEHAATRLSNQQLEVAA